MLRLETPDQNWLDVMLYWQKAYSDYFAGLDLPPQSVIGLLGPVSPQYLMALLALWQRRVMTLPLNPRLPAEQLEALLRQAGARACLGFGANGLTSLAWQDLPKTCADTYLELDLDPEQALTLIATSGSSGQPKLALHSYHNHLVSARGLAEWIPLGPADRCLLALPLYHVGGLAWVFRCLLSRATLCLPAAGQDLVPALIQLRPSHLSLVATQLYRLLEHPEAISVLQACQAILLGGSAIPRPLIERALAHGLPIHTSYGATEMSSTISCTPPGADLASLLTAGAVLPGRELMISDAGEILLRGETLFQGYLNRTATQASALVLPVNADGWFASRDRGLIDAQGRLQVLGRLDHLFISGGENIQPEEIEAALLSLHGVSQAIVVPIDDPEFGQRPLAFVEASSFEPQSWEARLREQLPGYKIPDHFLPWPAEQIGLKPSRSDLRRRGMQAFPSHGSPGEL